jgi:DNA-binding winged helix-turn-helix (wHTH) protein
MSLPRTRLLARLFASEARLVRLWAPPGYGKSSLVRLFARRFERHATCDCSGLSDVVAFAGRAMAALASESQSGESIAATRLRLHATEAEPAAWSRALLDAWKASQEHSLFIVEHAEAICENSGILAMLGDMLAARPAQRVILIGSRSALPLRFSHYLAPHQVVTLSRNDLRFDDEEAASVFEGTDLAPELVGRIVRLADGWPFALLLLALFAQYDANIEKLVDRLVDVPSENLHGYLANEVLSAFTPEMMSTMLAAAAIPNASLEDISAATGIRHATPIIDRLLHLPGFISSETGAYQMHPLLRGALRSQHGGDDTNYISRAASEYERSGDFLRAAELHGVYGDVQAAAAALDRLPITAFARPSSRLIEALTKIDISTLCAFPNLWIATLPYRRQNVATSRLYDEARRLLSSISPEGSAVHHRRLRVRLAALAEELGALSEARSLLETSGPADSSGEEPEERRLALMTSALIAAKEGRFSDADEFLDESDAVKGARHVRFDAERARIALQKARLLGDWHGALKLSEEAVYAAQRGGTTSRIIDATRAAGWAAWYLNDDERVTAANEMLADCGYSAPRAFVRYVEAILSRGAIDAPAYVLPIARWHAALVTADIEQAKELFDQALQGIEDVEDAFLHVVMRVSAALLLPVQRRRLLEARTVAAHIESPPLQASLELLIDSTEPSDYGIFKYIAARVARSPLKQRQDVLRVDVVRGEVRRGSEALHVSDRGLELLVALALMPAGTTKEELAAAIWPGLDGESAVNTLKMRVSRTRAQIADKEAVANTKRGYTLDERVAIDVREFERLLRDVRGSEAFGDPVRRHVIDAIRTLGAREQSYGAGWAWFAPFATHLDELQSELTLALARDAFRRGDASPPNSYAASSISRSP